MPLLSRTKKVAYCSDTSRLGSSVPTSNAPGDLSVNAAKSGPTRVADTAELVARGTASQKNRATGGGSSFEYRGFRKLFQRVSPVRRRGCLRFCRCSIRNSLRHGTDTRDDLLNLFRHCLGDRRRAECRFLDRSHVRQAGTQDRRSYVRVGGIAKQQLGQSLTSGGMGSLAKRIGKLLTNKGIGVGDELAQALDPSRIAARQDFPQPNGVPPNSRVVIVQCRHDISLGQAAQFPQRRQGLDARLRLAVRTGQAPQFGNSHLVR